MKSEPIGKNFQDDTEIHRLLNLATGKIDSYKKEEASRLEGELGEVQNAVSLLRNRLIAYRRALEDPESDARLAAALKQVNTALSQIVGVEYPVSGIHRDQLSQASELLKNLQGTAPASAHHAQAD